jgi:hypothetical protein
MTPFSTIAKRFLVACSLVLVTACGSNGITDPIASKSGYLTVSATVAPIKATVVAPVTSTGSVNLGGIRSKGMTVQSGYNVPAN